MYPPGRRPAASVRQAMRGAPSAGTPPAAERAGASGEVVTRHQFRPRPALMLAAEAARPRGPPDPSLSPSGEGPGVVTPAPGFLRGGGTHLP